MPFKKRRRSWNRIKDQYFIYLLRRRFRWWRMEIPRREQANYPLGIWLYLIKKFILERSNYFTAANLMSLCRGLLCYPMYLLFIHGYPLGGLSVFAVALITDFFDGHLARSFDQETSSGKIIDPLFDKTTIFTLVIVLIVLDVMPLWLAIAMAMPDISLIIMAIILKPLATALGITRESGANEYGKWKFIAQCITVSLFIFAILAGSISFLGGWFIIIGIITGLISIILAIGSIIEHAFPGCLKYSPDNLFYALTCKFRDYPIKTTVPAN